MRKCRIRARDREKNKRKAKDTFQIGYRYVAVGAIRRKWNVWNNFKYKLNENGSCDQTKVEREIEEDNRHKDGIHKFFFLTTSTTRATDSRILADVHSTKPYSEDNMELRQSLCSMPIRVYNSVKICETMNHRDKLSQSI